jgi:NAD(P)H-flavin reductase
MEKNMSCGMGMCGHCRIGHYYVCKDGPVFTYDQIRDFPDAWT